MCRFTSSRFRPLLSLLCALAFFGMTAGGVVLAAPNQRDSEEDVFGAPPPAESPAVRADDPDFAAGVRRLRERASRLASDESRAERRASRRKFRGQSRAEALQLARKAFRREFTSRLPDGDKPAAGVNVVRHVGDGVAVVEDTETDRRLLLRSTVPLQVPDPAGGQQPLDLSLTQRGGELAPEAAAVPVRIDDDGKAGVSLPGAGFSVSLRSDTPTDPLVESDRVFVANTKTDTDAAVVPQPFGAEIFLQLRSEDSPERYTFDVSLPEGAILRRARTDDPIPDDPPRALEVVRGRESLGYIYPPLGYDADGVPIETSIRPDGDTIVLIAKHRQNEIRYPALVDPEVIQWGRGAGNYGDWPGWGWTAVTYGSPSGFGSAKNNPAYYYGLYHSLPTHSTFNNGAYAEWYFRAPPNTYVYRAILGNMAHAPFTCAYPRTCSRWFNGITDYGNVNWESPVNYFNEYGNYGPNPFGPAEHGASGVRHDFCFEPRCDRSKGQEQNFAILGLQAFNPYGGPNIYTDVNRATNTMGWADVYLGDRRAPTLDTRPGDEGWRDDNFANHSLTAYARDAGLGGYSLSLAGVNGGNTQYASCPYGTGNNRTYNCPTSWNASWNYTLNEGVTQMTLSGQDVVGNAIGNGNNGSTHTWLRRIDRTPPSLSTLSGTLWDARNRDDDRRFAGLYAESYSVTASASDSYSGLRDIEVFIINAQGQPTRIATTTAGSITATLRPDDFPDGDYTIEIVARDNVQGQGGPDARHVAKRTFPVTIDRRGDIYNATEWSGDPSSGNERISREWTRLGSWDGRSESGAEIGTRRTIQCPGQSDPQKQCAEARLRVVDNEDEGMGSNDNFLVKVGERPDDDRIEPVSDLTKHTPPGSRIESGPIHSAAQPWQTLPPAHGPEYQLWRDETAAEEEDEGKQDAEKVVVLTWVDSKTQLPIKQDVTLPDGTGSRPIYFNYRAARLTTAEVPTDLFAVPRPEDPDSDERIEYRGGDQPQPSSQQTDRETGAAFTPMWIGATPPLGGVSLCYLSAQQVTSDVDAPAYTPAPTDDAAESPHRSGPITAVDADYSLTTNPAGCQPGRGDPFSPDLTISSYAKPSTVGAQWVETYDQAVTSALAQKPGTERAGREVTLVGTQLAQIYYVPYDEDELTALVDVGGTVLTIKGPFLTDAPKLRLILARLEAIR